MQPYKVRHFLLVVKSGFGRRLMANWPFAIQRSRIKVVANLAVQSSFVSKPPPLPHSEVAYYPSADDAMLVGLSQRLRR